jgi:hypothetical protein
VGRGTVCPPRDVARMTRPTRDDLLAGSRRHDRLDREGVPSLSAIKEHIDAAGEAELLDAPCVRVRRARP